MVQKCLFMTTLLQEQLVGVYKPHNLYTIPYSAYLVPALSSFSQQSLADEQEKIPDNETTAPKATIYLSRFFSSVPHTSTDRFCWVIEAYGGEKHHPHTVQYISIRNNRKFASILYQHFFKKLQTLQTLLLAYSQLPCVALRFSRMKNRVKSFSCALINLQALDLQEMSFFF